MKRPLLPAALTALLLGGIGAAWYLNSLPAPVAAPDAPAAARPAVSSKPTSPAAHQPTAAAASAAPAQAIRAPATSPAPKPQQTAAADPALDSADELLLFVQIGRMALSLVGVDEDAEDVWLAVINNPDIDPEARKDLIEDLNEDGFIDPKNITRDELPLIEARLALIEKLAPEALDDTNADAFKEAHKDLTNMRARLRPELAMPPAPAPTLAAPPARSEAPR